MPSNDPDPIDLLLQPRAPLVVRDGRPFGPIPGIRATSLPWPLPSTVAGALRTAIGQEIGLDWQSPHDRRYARTIRCAGPLPVARWAGDEPWIPYLPAPRDALVSPPDQSTPAHMHWLAPVAVPPGAGCNLPHPGLTPLRVETQTKAQASIEWWPLDDLIDWLEAPGRYTVPPERALGALPRETRVHVSIDAERQTARKGALFATEGLAFQDAPDAGHCPARAMLIRVADTPAGWIPNTPSFITLGGERRLTELAPAGPALWPTLPASLAGALAGSSHLRLLLATPALFERGWCPGWLDDTLEGPLPNAPEVRVRLIAAAVGRRQPVSGWDLETGGPKAVRFMAPAGSVYFFEILAGAGSQHLAATLWMSSVSDRAQDRRDGFGLVLPGIW